MFFLTFRIDYRFLNIFWCLLCSLSFLSIFFVVLYLFYGPCCLILNKWMDSYRPSVADLGAIYGVSSSCTVGPIVR